MNAASLKIRIQKIYWLRRRGHSIPEISAELGISKSTVSRYAKKVEILPQFYQRWLERRNASKIIAERQWKKAEEKAIELVQEISKRDLLLVGATLYWAEGAKRDFTFTNTDPIMIELFLSILRKGLGITNERITISLRVYEDLDRRQCLAFWSQVTGIRLDHTTTIDVLSGRKKGKLPYGMCRVRLKKGGIFLKEFQALARRIAACISPHSLTDKTRDS